MQHNITALVLTALLGLGAHARASVFSLDPGDGPADYIAFYPGNSSIHPERIDTAILGGTDRVLSQVTIYITALGLSDVTADVTVNLYSGTDFFNSDDLLWTSDTLNDELFTLDLIPKPLTFAAIGNVVLPDTIYYGVVLSNVLGNSVYSAGPQLSFADPTPTSTLGSPPSTGTYYWYLNSLNNTYVEVFNANPDDEGDDYWVAIDIVAVPEPATWLMAGLALATAFVLRKRR